MFQDTCFPVGFPLHFAHSDKPSRVFLPELFTLRISARPLFLQLKMQNFSG